MTDEIKLLDEFYVRTAFKSELRSIIDEPLQKLTVLMLQHAHPRYFTGPSSSSGRYHPKDEYICSAPDPTKAIPVRGKEYGGQVLHCRRVVKFARHLCKAHMFAPESKETQVVISAALVHDIAQYEEGTKGTIPFHEALVRPLTKDIPLVYPELKERWDSVIRLCETHSGQWGKDESYYPQTELEFLIHEADYLASRRETGEIDPDVNDWS